jgi:hypothetical protein
MSNRRMIYWAAAELPDKVESEMKDRLRKITYELSKSGNAIRGNTHHA